MPQHTATGPLARHGDNGADARASVIFDLCTKTSLRRTIKGCANASEMLPWAHVTSIVSRSSLVVAFIVRDGEEFITRNIRAMLRLGMHFQAIRIVYVENDSTDRTRLLLGKLQEQHPHIVSGRMLNMSSAYSVNLCPGDPSQRNCVKRVALLARLRNTAMHLAMQRASCLEAAAILVVDIDFVAFSAVNYLQSFARGVLTGRPAVFALSVYRSKAGSLAVYDRSSIVAPNEPNGSTSLCGATAQEIAKSCRVTLTAVDLCLANGHTCPQCPIPVSSGFGGFGTYWYSALKAVGVGSTSRKAMYQAAGLGVPEHVAFNRRINQKLHALHGGSANRLLMVIDPRMAPFYDYGEKWYTARFDRFATPAVLTSSGLGCACRTHSTRNDRAHGLLTIIL